LTRVLARARACVLVAASVLTASCASRAAFVPPVGPGAPAPDAAAIWRPLVEACAGVTSYRSEFALTGQVGDRRIRGLASARLYTAIGADGQIGLEASVSGQLLFRLGGAADRALLLVREENRIVTARPDEILDALIGVPIGPERLLAVVSGCGSARADVERAAQHGEVMEIVTSDATVYVAPRGAAWQVRAVRFGGVTVEYFTFRDGLPHELRIAAAGSRAQAVTLDLRVQAVQTNAALDPALFRVAVPEGATSISLDELRRVGPLAEETPGAVR
jgi:hypothetical protein